MKISLGEDLIQRQTVDEEVLIDTVRLLRELGLDVDRRGDDGLDTNDIFALVGRALLDANVQRTQINKPPITGAYLLTACIIDK